MTSLKNICIIVLLLLGCTCLHAQKDTVGFPKNGVDLNMLGNKGLIAVLFNHTIFEKKKMAVLITRGMGYVPGSHEDSSSNYTHFIAGANLLFGPKTNKLVLGTSYAFIIKGGVDKNNLNGRKTFSRVLGEIGYLHYFESEKLAVKVSASPIIFDDGANDVSNIAFGLSLRLLW